jgi:EpsI family protein
MKIPPFWMSTAGKSVVAVFLCAVAVGVCLVMPDPNSESVSGIRMELPAQHAGWIGEEIEPTEGEKRVLPPDTRFAKMRYIRGDEAIFVSIVLSGAEKRSIHRPEVCLPAQGWEIRSAHGRQIVLDDKRTLPVTVLTVARHVQLANGRDALLRSKVFYWFVGKDVVTASNWKRVFLTSYDRIFRQLNHRWAYVLVQTYVTEGIVPGGRNETDTEDYLDRFLSGLVPQFQEPSSAL